MWPQSVVQDRRIETHLVLASDTTNAEPLPRHTFLIESSLFALARRSIECLRYSLRLLNNALIPASDTANSRYVLNRCRHCSRCTIWLGPWMQPPSAVGWTEDGTGGVAMNARDSYLGRSEANVVSGPIVRFTLTRSPEFIKVGTAGLLIKYWSPISFCCLF